MNPAALQPAQPRSAASAALLALGRHLQACGYGFTPLTPATHDRHVRARQRHTPGALLRASTLRDVFGFSLPFVRAGIFERPAALLEAADALEILEGGACRSRLRFSTVEGQLFAHSAHPTLEADAVFLGPDTVRFCRLLRDALPKPRGRLVEIGAGSGAPGILLAAAAARAGHSADVVLTDINPQALRLSAVNAALAGVDVRLVEGDGLSGVDGVFDAVVVNPPYLVDPQARAYRHGGDRGIALALRFLREGLSRLAPEGSLVLYTGAPVVDGVDLFHQAAWPLLADVSHHYEEIDPDVFGEEVGCGAYVDVERVAVVALCVGGCVRSPKQR
jgi:hypothetical protein